MTIELTPDDVRRLIPLLENAIAEVDAAATPDATIQPDDPMALMESYDWGQSFLFKLRLARGVAEVKAEPSDPHGVAHAKCRLCNYTCVSVFPVGVDTDALECARCGRMTLEIDAA